MGNIALKDFLPAQSEMIVALNLLALAAYTAMTTAPDRNIRRCLRAPQLAPQLAVYATEHEGNLSLAGINDLTLLSILPRGYSLFGNIR
jgi:hypothetical protein